MRFTSPTRAVESSATVAGTLPPTMHQQSGAVSRPSLAAAAAAVTEAGSSICLRGQGCEDR